MNTTLDVDTRLQELGDCYTYRVNMLLEEDRADLAALLAANYTHDAARILAG
ncbi:MAG: hypothetical protein ACR2LX_04795 [Jatrophihabitans sp.]